MNTDEHKITENYNFLDENCAQNSEKKYKNNDFDDFRKIQEKMMIHGNFLKIPKKKKVFSKNEKKKKIF